VLHSGSADKTFRKYRLLVQEMAKMTVISLFQCCLKGCYETHWPEMFMLAQMIDLKSQHL